jgi:hypothetical protein
MIMDGFQNCLTGRKLLALHSILYISKQLVVQRGQVQTVRWMGENLPAILLNPHHAKMSSVRPYVIVLQDDLFSSLDICHKWHTEASEVSEGCVQH